MDLTWYIDRMILYGQFHLGKEKHQRSVTVILAKKNTMQRSITVCPAKIDIPRLDIVWHSTIKSSGMREEASSGIDFQEVSRPIVVPLLF